MYCTRHDWLDCTNLVRLDCTNHAFLDCTRVRVLYEFCAARLYDSYRCFVYARFCCVVSFGEQLYEFRLQLYETYNRINKGSPAI
jgi:hypothetical protein